MRFGAPLHHMKLSASEVGDKKSLVTPLKRAVSLDGFAIDMAWFQLDFHDACDSLFETLLEPTAPKTPAPKNIFEPQIDLGKSTQTTPDPVVSTPDSVISSLCFSTAADKTTTTTTGHPVVASSTDACVIKEELEEAEKVGDGKISDTGNDICYKKLKILELRNMLHARGLSRRGRKQELVDRLVQADHDGIVANVAKTMTPCAETTTTQLRQSSRKRKAVKLESLEHLPFERFPLGEASPSKTNTREKCSLLAAKTKKKAKNTKNDKNRTPAKKAKKKPAPRVLKKKDPKFRLCAYLCFYQGWDIADATQLTNYNPHEPSVLRRYVNGKSDPDHPEHHLWKALRLSEDTLPAAGQHFGLLDRYPHLKLEQCACGALQKNGVACQCGFCPASAATEGDTWEGSNGEYLCKGHKACSCPGGKGQVDLIQKVRDCRSERGRRS